MRKFKVGDRVRAREDCCNDFAGGEGIIEKIGDSPFSGIEMVIRMTKDSRYYKKGKCTSQAGWGEDIELMSVDPNDEDYPNRISVGTVNSVIGSSAISIPRGLSFSTYTAFDPNDDCGGGN